MHATEKRLKWVGDVGAANDWGLPGLYRQLNHTSPEMLTHPSDYNVPRMLCLAWSNVTTLCLKKHVIVTTFSTITLTIGVRLQ